MSKPLSLKLRKFIKDYDELSLVNETVVCNVCKQNLNVYSRGDCKKHVNNIKHKRNRKTGVYTDCLFDLCFMFCACSLPWKLLDNVHFRKFWKKCAPSSIALPCETYVRRVYLQRVYETIMHSIKADIQDSYVWVSVDETTDFRGNNLVNVVLRNLTPNNIGPPYLIWSKCAQRTTAKTIEETVLAALCHVAVDAQNVLMLVTTGAAYMKKAAQALKHYCSNMIHVICLAHTLHRVAEEIRNQYPAIDQLIWNTKGIFAKARLRCDEFLKRLPQIPLPPQLDRTRWCTWLEAVEYYAKNFNELKEFIMELNPQESTAIRNSQKIFQNPCIYNDLQTVYYNFYVLVVAVRQLENRFLPLADVINTMGDIQKTFSNFSDSESVVVANKFKHLLENNNGYRLMCDLVSNKPNAELPGVNLECFAMAQLTSVDMESFSLHNFAIRPCRWCLSAVNAERILVLNYYARASEHDISCAPPPHNMKTEPST